jgi:very-short-patch-repair endonuclease
LRRNGWIVLRFWEHALKRNSEKIVSRIVLRLKK